MITPRCYDCRADLTNDPTESEYCPNCRQDHGLPRWPHIYFNPADYEDFNVFAVRAAIKRTMRREGLPEPEIIHFKAEVDQLTTVEDVISVATNWITLE